LDAHEERLETGDASRIAEWRHSDWQFHQALISACGSRVLMQTHAEIFDKYLRYQMIALAFRPSASRPEHGALKDAALRRDTQAAVELLRHHLRAGVEHALSQGRLAG
ncbi:MAG TPA: FCD domain-containing protein, partial [Paracoccus sp. (in: a-proteobacteria)]|uniref:FCD domain-containing protein n=1 Tax=Paracoccus sp. TaxID=267 RepID=UPI002CDD09B5